MNEYATLDVVDRFIGKCRSRRLRSMREFAEAEIVIPDGPYKDRPYRASRQPFAAAWFDLVEANPWRLVNSTGPVQSGKTLLTWVIPILYHLFELNENVIAGLPSMDVAGDKWREDLFPVIASSRYAGLLPRTGGGSKGGSNFTAIKFRNGPTLKFMSAGGSDKKRAGFTSRVVAITEVDGFSESADGSPETDKVSQLHARTKAYGARARIYQECTVTTDAGRIWTEYTNGTASRIVRPCPHCHEWTTPERQNLIGWQDAPDVETAKERARWQCPACAADWSEDERRAANAQARIVHRGQEVTPAGEIVGPPPRTDSLGFRWSAVDNHFLDAADVAAEEWTRARGADPEAGERYILQFMYATPTESERAIDDTLTPATIAQRQRPEPVGVIPTHTDRLTIGVDIGRHLIHWSAVAWTAGADPHIVEYQRHDVASRELGDERALIIALRELRERFEAGFQFGDEIRTPDAVWIDAGWTPDPVYAFCAEASDGRYKPTKGFGAGQERKQYTRPRQSGAIVKTIGDGWHIVRMRRPIRGELVEIDANHWKTWVHSRLKTPVGQPGALTLYKAPPNIHLTFSAHMTAEKRTERFIRGRGMVDEWIREGKSNHWFDATTLAAAAANYLGVRLIDGTPRRPAPPSNTDRGWFESRKRRRRA